MNKETSDKHYVFYEEKKVCNRGRARYLLASASFKKFPVSDEFSAAVCVLPENYDERAYFNFIEKWGTVSTIKGTLSPQVLAQVDNNNFEIVGPTFSNTVREFRRLLYRIGCKCKGISTDFEKLSIFYRK